MSSKQDPWVRLFCVSDPCLHKNGFTVYKVQSTVFPRNAPEATTKITVWKRFNDFKKLFKSLHSLHTNLHLSGIFPSFPRSHVFGRFDPEVIEERRQSALNLLEFVAGHSPLFTSQPFLRFFEGGNDVASKPVEDEEEEVGCVILEPIKLYEAPAEHDYNSTPRLTDVGQRRSGGGENDSSVDSDEEETSDRDDDNDMKSCSLLSLFDPLCPSECPVETDSSSCSQGATGSNWLVAALSSTVSKSDNSLGDNNDLLQFPKAFADFEDESERKEDCSIEQVSSSTVHDRRGDYATAFAVPSPRPPSSLCAFDSVFDDDEDVKPRNEIEVRLRSEDYVLVAAEQLKRAQDNESCGNYGVAFALYKTVVGTLLSGVREDLDCDRRDAVRRKTAQYIKRAEEIHEKYLSVQGKEKSSPTEGPSWDSISIDNCLSKLPASELGRYKVLGVVDKVLLVSDRSTDDTCVVKIVHKSSTVSQTWKRVILPVSIPYVVQLLHYHETDDAFYLVLRHAGGGKLWNYVGSYLQSGALNSKVERGDSLSDQNAFNIYAGKKFLDVADGVRQYSDAMVSLGTESSEGVTFNKDVTDSSLLDTKELLSKAKRLIEHVTETLHESERVYGAQLSSQLNKESSSVCCRRDSDTDGRRRRLKKRPSDDAFFAPIKDGSVMRRRASAGSSLELQGNRVRHFSSVFRELDVDNDANGIHLPESCVQIWAGEIAAALMGLHSFGIICWDLNPDNILLDDRGHILLSYFGCLPGVDVALDPYAKEMHYVAPELVGISQVDQSCDWWSFGALLFELLTGKTLCSCHPGGFSRHTILNIPCQLSIEAESILKELLCYNPRERLGSGPEGDSSIQTHPFFSGLGWDKLRPSRDINMKIYPERIQNAFQTQNSLHR